MNFFKKQSGRWFSQRTTHYLKAGDSKAGKSDLEIVYIDTNADDVVRICDQVGWFTKDAIGGLRIVQKSTILGGQTRSQSTLLVAIATDDSSGKLVSQPNDSDSTQISQYRFENDVLTIVTEANDLRSEERWWFITERLRMRTNVLSDANGQTMASFCSEIKLGEVKT
ncbi:MAG: phycobiliprotein lyase [Leptolyngbyaceae cyanobacterium MAG.088]|nr:phycobiliprotein lyase [Leptolyngbyaceae cyanobacterium MAG.088]